MKKTIAILLALMLMVTVFILPVLAAEQRAHTCPHCGETAYTTWQETISSEDPVVSCSNYPASHSHTVRVTLTHIYCDYCRSESIVKKVTSASVCPYA